MQTATYLTPRKQSIHCKFAIFSSTCPKTVFAKPLAQPFAISGRSIACPFSRDFSVICAKENGSLLSKGTLNGPFGSLKIRKHPKLIFICSFINWIIFAGGTRAKTVIFHWTVTICGPIVSPPTHLRTARKHFCYSSMPLEPFSPLSSSFSSTANITRTAIYAYTPHSPRKRETLRPSLQATCLEGHYTTPLQSLATSQPYRSRRR